MVKNRGATPRKIHLGPYCPLCGCDHGEPPWGDDGRCPTFNFCSCCGVEFGYEDCTIEGGNQFRSKWLTSGARWFDGRYKPQGWDLERQLRNIYDGEEAGSLMAMLPAKPK